MCYVSTLFGHWQRGVIDIDVWCFSLCSNQKVSYLDTLNQNKGRTSSTGVDESKEEEP